jgi:class 3 adenylate cyclase
MVPMRRHAGFWVLLGIALLIGMWAVADQYQRIGRPAPGFGVMENLLVGVGGVERGGLQPLDVIVAMNGRLLSSAREIQAGVAEQPAGTVFRYTVNRGGQLTEAEVRSRTVTRRDFGFFLLEGLLPGLLVLALGALVFLLKPGSGRGALFLTFALTAYLVSVTYRDAHTVYRFHALFLAAWAFWPAIFIHLALTFPQRRKIARRFPRIVWAPYVLSAAIGALLLVRVHGSLVQRAGVIAGLGSAYWGLALVLLVLALARTTVAGSTPLMRQRARVLAAAFAIGYLAPVLGTATEAVFRVTVPHLRALWALTLAFPAAMAYALVRYDLFDARAALRLGTVYSVATGLVILAYAGAIAALDLVFSRLGLASAPLVPAAVIAVAVVLFLNPLYIRAQRLIDRLFFRQRVDLQHTVERVAERMTGLLDLRRVVELLTGTVDGLLHPTRQTLLLYAESEGAYTVPGEEGTSVPALPRDAPLPASLARMRVPLTRDRIEEDSRLADLREGCLGALATLDAELAVPVLFQDRLTGILALGRKRSDDGYSTEDLRILRLLVNQSALALEHAKAYAALEAANLELQGALRRVEILESIRASLAKFVPKTVQELIEAAPEAPELDKREADVSVLFVDIAGYTRLSERLDATRVNELVERYFGAFLDEILRRGGDVNETAGDGLMVIFRDADPVRHARAAVRSALGILRRTQEINERRLPGEERIRVHVGVNSGLATVGATKIEGRTGTRWTYTASGPVTNVAARLAALGQGDAVMVGGETRRRLGAELAFEPLGDQHLRNLAQPVAVFRLTVPAPQAAAVPAVAAH